jgi:hypothetical protein
MNLKKHILLGFIGTVVVIVAELGINASQLLSALPPPEDIPEEILRTEIITAARSPVDGKPLTAAEYAEIQVSLQTVPPPKLDPKIRENVFLLRLRKGLLQIFPFLNI